MSISFLDIIETIKEYGMWGLVLFLALVISLLLKILFDEDKSNLWRARFYKVLYKLSKKREAEKKYIATDVTGHLNLARRQMPFGKDLIPKSLKIEWIETARGESYVPKEGELAVKLDPAEMQEKNIVLLAQALIRKTTLAGVRYILEKPLEAVVDLNMIKNLLKQIKNRAILDWYMENEYMPRAREQDVEKWNSRIVEIDERGLFTRLLLVELEDYGRKIAGRPATNEMKMEIEGLVEFLYKIATKGYGEIAPLEYITRNIKVGVLLVGQTSKILLGVEPYMKAFFLHLNKQPEAIYLVSFSKEFLKEKDEQSEKVFEDMRRHLYERIEKEFQVKKDFELTYSCYDVAGRKRKAKCVRYFPIYT